MSNIVLNREQLAWAAGFMDGEGHFGVQTRLNKNRKTPYSHLILRACQIDIRVLEKLNSILPGGHIHGPYLAPNRQNPVWAFQISTFEKVQPAVAILWPWLGPVKRIQAKKALLNIQKYYQRPKVKPGRKRNQPDDQ